MTPTEERDLILKRSEYLVQQLNTDTLTGLKTRRVFWLELEESLKAVRARRLEEVSLIAIDIDHFKQINDTYGHSVGDEVLQKIGALLQETVRGTQNIAARMGGEEISILMPGVSKEDALAEAEKLRVKISSIAFKNSEIKVTASFGVESSKETTNPQGLYNLADEKMYSAKGSGRDRVNGSSKKEQ